MFLDLLLRNSNELSSSHKKIQSKSDIKAVSGTGGKDDDDDDDEEEQQQKKQKNINYSYNLNPTMAVNVNKNPKIQQKLEYINDVLSKRTPSLEQQMNLARRACWCNGKADRQAMDQNVGWHRERDKERKCCENCFNDENATKMVLNGATNKSKLNNINDEADNNIEDNNNKTDDDSKLNDSARVNLNNPITMNSSKSSENNLSKRKTTVATIKNSENCVNSENSEQVHMNNPNKSVNMNSNTINNETQNELENSNNLTDQLLEYIRIQLINLWLTFVAFCDKNTIKSNDPRFEMYRQREQQQQEEKLQQQQQQQQASTSTNASTAKKSGQFKLLTSKKVIFLLLVCFFFTFINRIEARPNTNAPELIAAPASATSAIATEKSDFVQQPPHDATKLTPSVPISSSSDNHDDVNAHADEEHGDHPKRYPLSQIEFDRVKTPFIIGIWILSASIAKIGFHMTPKLHLIFPESCLLIVVGVVIGIILMYCTDVAVSPLTPNTFFFYMLPPIILDAGYFMPNRLFFDNLGTILLMAGVGTIFNIATIGGSLWACGQSGIFGNNTPEFLDIFLFASLISAVDPVAVLAVFEEIHVNEILYIVVFGESLLNDAVTVVMYHMMEVYDHIGIDNMIAQDVVSGIGSFFVVAVGGTVIGIIWGFLTGLVTRFTDHVRVIEPIFIFVMAYLAYLNAEIFHMSGILAITFCGITMKNYVESNISQKSHTTVKYALKMLSSSSETIIFMFLGVATVNNDHVWNTWFVILTILFCSVFRVIGVIILTAMANRFRLHKLSRVDQFVMSYGGLRGAVAFALVLLIDENLVPQKNMFVTTTIAVIYFTVFLQGITIKPLVKILNVKRASKRKPTMNERIHERFMDHLMAGIEDIVGKTGNYNVRDKFKRFDNRFIRPLLIRDLKGAEPKIIETYSKLTMRDAIEVMRRNPSTIGQISGTESMSALFRNYTNNCIGGRWAPPSIYTTCPSLTNLDNTCSRNLDMHELDYNPSKKDLTDAKIHHLLAEELKPYRRHRRLSYSRHAVDDRDLSTQVNYKMQMNFRRMFNDRKHHKRSKRGASKHQEGVKQNHVSFHDFQQNGTTKQFSHGTSKHDTKNLRKKLIRKHSHHNSLNKYRRLEIDQYINDVLNETAEERQQPSKLTEVTVQPDDWEEGLTFTAKSSLPENAIPEEDRTISRDSDGERRVATPTATESQLPWKRQGDELTDAVQQNEFPAWASNKEYLAYNSPSATFLGGINKPKQPMSVIGLFRRESSGSRGGVSLGAADGLDSAGSARGSDPALAAALSGMVVVPSHPHNPRLDKRSQSISSGTTYGADHAAGGGHAGPFPVTASHRRNVRRGSMLELSGDIIPEESYHHGYSKSLCEPQGEEWESVLADAERNSTSTNSEKLLRGNERASGREPLLARLTPRAQIRRGMMGMGSGSGSGNISGLVGAKKNPVTTALLSSHHFDYEDEDEDDDDEEEDFDLYDDENIVVTTTTTEVPSTSSSALRKRFGIDDSNDQPPTTQTTTTIRLTRNNDESII